ncbi:MAG: hypothetical protein EXX96DRAFT_579940 [Benjaminiella poitrasii]|nr:MAG: hypothetical protein EXX96DRAFT_579940 [Benjaminiella poitrasii]
MGLPLYKPRKDSENISQKTRQQQLPECNLEDRDELWPALPHRLIQNAFNHNRRSSLRPSSANNHFNTPFSSSPFSNNNNSINNRNTQTILFQPRMRSRISRRHSMLTSSLMDRRRASRVHQSPGAVTIPSSTSPPFASELDRQLQQRINEKEDLLEQLRATISLIDQFLLTSASPGSFLMSLPSFITEDLPMVIESASSLAAMIPTVLSSVSPTSNISSADEPTTLSGMIDRLLQIPPYSTRINSIESNIISAHRRLREHLSALEALVPSSSDSLSTQSSDLNIENPVSIPTFSLQQQ